MAEVPSGGVFGTPWQVFGTLGPTRKKQMALGIIPRAICFLRLIAPEHYSSKINLRMRRPPFEAEGALRCVEC